MKTKNIIKKELRQLDKNVLVDYIYNTMIDSYMEGSDNATRDNEYDKGFKRGFNTGLKEVYKD